MDNFYCCDNTIIMEILMKIHIKKHEELAEYGDRLRLIREELGLSQTELSKAEIIFTECLCL